MLPGKEERGLSGGRPVRTANITVAGSGRLRRPPSQPALAQEGGEKSVGRLRKEEVFGGDCLGAGSATSERYGAEAGPAVVRRTDYPYKGSSAEGWSAEQRWRLHVRNSSSMRMTESQGIS